MTQISGKKYQIKNAAGTENRFPYTVMEAVLGLNSYLQDQFSALADIYMPIEGITESKTGQEFVYRKSPATIKAKSLTLDRIYGKTLVWNQLVQNGNFANGTTGWRSYGGIQISAANNEATIIATANGQAAYTDTDTVVGHKYLLSFYAKAANDYKIYYTKPGGQSSFLGNGSYNKYSQIAEATNTRTRIEFDETHSSDWQPFYLKDVMLIDLTLIFDSGNEPSTVAEFESLFPLSYYPYNPGTLISNDAESLETVGFNKWDEEWELGALDSTIGGNISSSTQIRSKNYIPVIPNTVYYRKNPYSDAGPGHYNRVAFYDSNKNFLGSSGWDAFDGNNTFTTPNNAAYMRFYVNASAYAHDICINLSDPAKNGTYEPYRKTTLQLGLNNFKVKSHNIWDEQCVNGYYNSSASGAFVSNPNYLACKNKIPVESGNTYYFKMPAIYQVFWYGANGAYLSNENSYTESRTFVAPSNAKYMAFYVGGNYIRTYGGYNNDICINVSSSFNGQYEPHGDIAITGGLKRAGTAFDEIVGNKLIQRIKRVNLGDLTWNYSSSSNFFASTGIRSEVSTPDSESAQPNAMCSKYLTATYSHVSANDKELTIIWSASSYHGGIWVKDSAYTDKDTFKAAMDGVYLDYELATPIEYELVEPLVYSMAAGTTEARVSPNTDGLSAPFCCDMTYDANANNDAASSVYAMTAGKLLNSHTLWGQSFDGSADVSGAMTGVDSINGLVTFGANRMVEIGSQNSGGTARVYGLLSANSLSSVGNMDVGGNIVANGAGAQHSFDGTTTIKDLNVTSAAYFGKSNSPVDVYVRGPFTVGSASVNKPTKLNGTLNATGNTTIGGTFTVGTSSVNKATTLYGALTASGAVSFTSTLGVTGLSTLAGGIKLTTTKKIWFGDTYYIELDDNNHLHTNAGFYSTSFITAGGVGSGSGGGSNLVKERAYDISLTQIASSDYAELIRSPYISDSESGFMFAYSPAFLDTASQMHDYVIDAIGHEIGSCDIQWIGIAIGSTYTDAGVFDSGAFLVLAKSGNTYYWYEFEV